MSLVFQGETIPLAADADGVIRVGKTRVTLDTLVYAFLDGSTVEGIVDQYPSLDLGDVYTAIGYYLRHRSEVDVYLATREKQAAEIRAENERRFNPVGIRARLLARQKRQG